MIKKIKKMLPIFIVVGIIYTLIKLNYLNQYSYSFLSNQDEYIYATDFEDGNISQFESRGGTTQLSISNKYSSSGNNSLLVSNRTQEWNGPQIKISDLGNASVEYLISAKVMNLNSTNVSIYYKYKNSDGVVKYFNLGNYTGDGWQSITDLKFSFTSDMQDVYILFQGGTEDMYIDDFSIKIASIEQEIPSLKNVYSSYFKIGTVISSKNISSKPTQDLILKHFNSVTLGNELKPDYILDKEASLATGVYDNPQVNIDSAREILNFCRDNNISVRGHTLIWYDQTPEWFFRENYDENQNFVSKDVMIKRMENFIKNLFTVLKEEYPTIDFYAWDVVNEAWLDNGNYRSYCENTIEDKVNGLSCSAWTTIFKDNSFIEYAFEFARKFSPSNTKLYYCDFNEYVPLKRDAIYNMAMKLKEKNIIDGLGLHAHLTYNFESEEKYQEHLNLYNQALDVYASTGLDIQITELDIAISNSNFVAQDKFYNDFVNMIAKHANNISSLVFWGTTDDMSWKQSETPLLFNKDYTAKSCFYKIIDNVIKLDYGNLKIENSFLKNIFPKTNYTNFLKNITTNDNYIVYELFDINKVIKNGDLATGDYLKISLSDGKIYEYQIIVNGDINGDSTLTLVDVMKLANYIYKDKYSLSEIYQKAADYDSNGLYNLQDIMKMASNLYSTK